MPPKSEHPVRVRFAPSPTGHWHLGGARTTIFNWLFARQHGGALVLRIEDTDKARSKPEFEAEIIEVLGWLGLDFDEGPTWRMENGERRKGESKGGYGPYRQSERTAIYRKYLEQLLADGNAYYCYCTKEDLEAERQLLASQSLPQKYGGHCSRLTAPPTGREPQAIRFRVPGTKVSFTDLVRGAVSFDATLFGDIIIAKDLDSPLYNFAVVVDDELMQISHVIRGEEHLGNTPKQILMQKALGFREPVYAHVPLILNPDRSKMSKRYAETSMISYRDAGYLPEALLNFLVLLGWHPKHDGEVLSREELVQEFAIERIQKAGAIFDEQKLNWLDHEYIKRLDVEALAQLVAPRLPNASDKLLRSIILMVRDRAKTLADFVEESKFVFELPSYEADLLRWKTDTAEQTKQILLSVQDALQQMNGEMFVQEALRAALEPLVAQHGRGSVYWPLRVALSGLKASPDPLTIAETLGQKEALQRLGAALKKLS